jgi:AcrR family transcriptional regulator
MSPRPRQVQDDTVLDAAEAVMAALGPMRFTVDEVARRVGVSAPALLQRFGSKRALELAVNERAVRRTQTMVEDADRASGSPLTALWNMLEQAVRAAAPTPDAMAHSFAFLHVDLADDARRAMIMTQVRAIRRGVKALVTDAIASGEVRGIDAATLATMLEVVYNGALLGWVVDRKGSAWTYVRKRLDTLVAPYRTAHAPRR